MHGAVFLVDSEPGLIELVNGVADNYFCYFDSVDTVYIPSDIKSFIEKVEAGEISEEEQAEIFQITEDDPAPSLATLLHQYYQSIVDRVEKIGKTIPDESDDDSVLDSTEYELSDQGHCVEVPPEPICTAEELGYPRRQKILYIVDENLIPEDLRPISPDLINNEHDGSIEQVLGAIVREVVDFRKWMDGFNAIYRDQFREVGLDIAYKILIVSDTPNAESLWGLDVISRRHPFLGNRLSKILEDESNFYAPSNGE